MKKFFASIVLLCTISVSAFAAEADTSATFDRGVGKMNSVFIPKGYIGAGVSFSYKTYEFGQGPMT